MRVQCTNPTHQDANPSMTVYEDGGFCHSCGYLDRSVVDTESSKKMKENLENTVAHIKSLPEKEIRGLQLPYDFSGYYILWPNGEFYKKRLWEGETRYVGPVGHKPPLLQFNGLGTGLVIVEGELNAVSLSMINKSNIVSPGSIMNLMNYLHIYLLYDPIYAIVDKDAIGVATGIALKRELLKRGKRVQLIACTKDLNQLLQDEGIEGLKKWQKENLEM